MTFANLPDSMRAVQASDYGDIDAVIRVVDQVPVPRLSDLPPKQQKNKMILKTLAVSLAPGDCRVLSGKTRELQGPPSFPYIPGGDCCGIVMELPEGYDSNNNNKNNELAFTVGDRVVARFVDAPRGALGEYALVSTLVAAKVPDDDGVNIITSEEAAATVSSSPAIALADYIHSGERVLVLGAGGGVGATFCQAVRHLRGASYVVGVSRSPELLLQPPISCDKAVDYTTTDVFSVEEFRRNKFDVVVDLAGGGFGRLEECVRGHEPLIVKPGSMGGRFITTVPIVGPVYEMHSIWEVLKVFLFTGLWKAFTSRTWYRSKLPKYTFALCLSKDRVHATRSLDLVHTGKIKPVIDGKGPFPFTTEGVRSAFQLQESRHAHGKVVVHVADA